MSAEMGRVEIPHCHEPNLIVANAVCCHGSPWLGPQLHFDRVMGWMAPLRHLGAKVLVGQEPPANREPSMSTNSGSS